MFVIGRVLFVGHCLLLAACDFQRAVRVLLLGVCLLCVVCCLLCVVRCSLLVAVCLLRVA